MPVSNCICKSPQQDAIHGLGRRVFNNFAKGIRCTVCGNEKIKEVVKTDDKKGKKK